MAITYKVLGQSNPAATTQTTLYTVPGSTSTVMSTLTVCNQASTAGTFRIAVQQAGAALDPKQYINYDTTVPANDTITVTIGLTMAATDVISVYSSSGSISFTAFGQEVA